MRLSTKILACIAVTVSTTAGAAPPSADVSVSTLLSHGVEPSVTIEPVQEITVAQSKIVSDNVRAMGTIYTAAVLEEMKLFEVADRIVALHAEGKLPIGKGGANAVERYRKLAGKHLDRATRARIYAHALGVGASTGSSSNTDFAPLWARFIEAAAEHEGQLAKPKKGEVSQQALRAAARDLGENVTLYGYGAARFASQRLAHHLEAAMALLSTPELRTQYGAQSTWDVIETVATKDLGGGPAVEPLRAQAVAAARLMRWIALATKDLESGTAKLPPLPPGDAEQWKKLASKPWKAKPAPPKGKPVGPLCFDKQLQLVGCKVL